MFASSIPEIIELVGSGSKYSGELKREHGKRYPISALTFVYQPKMKNQTDTKRKKIEKKKSNKKYVLKIYCGHIHL